ncbi:MAG TPA: Hsp20/alpha crystallin family protein [Acidimicrobiales bacterium]
MLLRFDPFREVERELDRLTSFGGKGFRPATMPMDAWRHGDHVYVRIDLPGVDPSTVDLTVERNVLTVTAERAWQKEDGAQVLVAERPQGRFSRQLFLGEGLDPDRIEATYDAGVLTIHVPVAEQAKPRKVEVAMGTGSTQPHAIDATSKDATAAA